MAGYEHPSDKDRAAHHMRIALVACRAALVAEAERRGEADGEYEFPAQPAIAAATDALKQAEAAFGFPGAQGDYAWTGNGYEPLPSRSPQFTVNRPEIVENDSLSAWLAGVFDRIDRFLGRKKVAP